VTIGKNPQQPVDRLSRDREEAIKHEVLIL
jgi:hypothetical protein